MNDKTERRPRRYSVKITHFDGAWTIKHVWAYDANDAVFQATLGLGNINNIIVEPAPESTEA